MVVVGEEMKGRATFSPAAARLVGTAEPSGVETGQCASGPARGATVSESTGKQVG